MVSASVAISRWISRIPRSLVRPGGGSALRRVEGDVPGAPPEACGTPRRIAGAEEPRELEAGDRVRGGDVQDPGDVERRELEQRGGEIGDVRRAADLVRRGRRRRRARRAPPAGRAFPYRSDVRTTRPPVNEALGLELRLPVGGDGARLVVLAVGRVLAVEDEVGGEVDEPGASRGCARRRCACCGRSCPESAWTYAVWTTTSTSGQARPARAGRRSARGRTAPARGTASRPRRDRASTAWRQTSEPR